MLFTCSFCKNQMLFTCSFYMHIQEFLIVEMETCEINSKTHSNLTDDRRVFWSSSDSGNVSCGIACLKVRICVLEGDLIVQIQVSLRCEINGFRVGDRMWQLRLKAVLVGDILDSSHSVEWINVWVRTSDRSSSVADLRVSSWREREKKSLKKFQIF